VVSASLWRRGKKVVENSVLPGTTIATFPVMLGKGKRFRFKGRSAIFVRNLAGDGIEVYDQYLVPSKRFSKRTLDNDCSRSVSNNVAAFYVIELHEDPSSQPALCGPLY
jgi:hypothetical protein